MKKITLIVVTGILISVFFSCTPESVLNGSEDIKACCVDEGTIELPPPPPPKDGDGD